MKNILILHGPNLNLLGSREPEHYGSLSLETINANLHRVAEDYGVDLQTFQSNAEHDLVNAVQQAEREGVDFIIINPAAFTHTSVAIRDALSASRIPFIEVHLSNVHAREPFRKHSYYSDIAQGVVAGLGASGYTFALTYACDTLGRDSSRD
ncbi:MAG: type II 3-dehydroquinate dehydratase [Pseudomonadota bacterium]